jgi:ABC-2 type transport system ATP-binding protein
MRRRIDLACGLVHRPRLLFLDEPTTGVDPTSRAALWDELRRLQGDGVSLFLTTHYLEEADRLCDRLAIVDRGVIVARGTPDELKAEVGADVVTVGVAEEEGERAAGVLGPLGQVRLGGGGRSIALELTDGAAAVAGIVERLRGAGIVPATITVARPTLDDVFLRYTGATIEEHDEPLEPAGGRR